MRAEIGLAIADLRQKKTIDGIVDSLRNRLEDYDDASFFHGEDVDAAALKLTHGGYDALNLETAFAMLKINHCFGRPGDVENEMLDSENALQLDLLPFAC